MLTLWCFVPVLHVDQELDFLQCHICVFKEAIQFILGESGTGSSTLYTVKQEMNSQS